MTLGTIVYLLVLIIASAMFVIDLSYGMVAILGTIIVLPIVMLIFLIIIRVNTSVSVECKNPLSEKTDINESAKATVIMNVENKCRFLPIQKGIAKVRYINKFSGEEGKIKVRFSVDSQKLRSRRIAVDIQHCGNVLIYVEKVKLYDYLSIFEPPLS